MKKWPIFSNLRAFVGCLVIPCLVQFTLIASSNRCPTRVVAQKYLPLTIIIILFFMGKSTPILYLFKYNRVKFFTRRPGQPPGRYEHMFYEEGKEKRLDVSVCTPLHQVSLLVLISIKYIHTESFLLNHSINHL